MNLLLDSADQIINEVAQSNHLPFGGLKHVTEVGGEGDGQNPITRSAELSRRGVKQGWWEKRVGERKVKGKGKVVKWHRTAMINYVNCRKGEANFSRGDMWSTLPAGGMQEMWHGGKNRIAYGSVCPDGGASIAVGAAGSGWMTRQSF
ncbi:hypothetical protein EV426DRAFT_708634 [Tirmania nivea]|nr:hypothetical protein EV426DRAFT_708634 [Tirmania nivea]